jgi:hypothetical protein
VSLVDSSGVHSTLSQHSRALVVVSTEEERLPAMIADAFVRLALRVCALRIAAQHTRFKVLAEPVRVGQREVGKCLFALHIVPANERKNREKGRRVKRKLEQLIYDERRLIVNSE